MRTYSEDHLLLRDPTFDHVRDVLEHMRCSESSTYRRPLNRPVEPFNGLWRQQIITWMYTLVKYCKLRHESVACGAYFLDVAVATGVIKTPSDYQLGAMTALYLGLKVFDSPSMRVVKLSSLAKLGNAEFTERDIVRMEREMVTAMGWRLCPPTPNCFLQQYLVLLPTQTEATKNLIEKKALEAIEVSVSKECFFSCKPSVLGYAALLIGLDQYLEAQKGAVPGSNMELISLWQLRSFLHNMANIAKLDHTSALVSQTSTLLERALQQQQLPITKPQDPMASPKSTVNQSSYEFEARDSNSASSSPTNVVLR